MRKDQRGAKEDCSGTTDQLRINRIFFHAGQPKIWAIFEHGLNHRWLIRMLALHRFHNI